MYTIFTSHLFSFMFFSKQIRWKCLMVVEVWWSFDVENLRERLHCHVGHHQTFTKSEMIAMFRSCWDFPRWTHPGSSTFDLTDSSKHTPTPCINHACVQQVDRHDYWPQRAQVHLLQPHGDHLHPDQHGHVPHDAHQHHLLSAPRLHRHVGARLAICPHALHQVCIPGGARLQDTIWASLRSSSSRYTYLKGVFQIDNQTISCLTNFVAYD